MRNAAEDQANVLTIAIEFPDFKFEILLGNTNTKYTKEDQRAPNSHLLGHPVANRLKLYYCFRNIWNILPTCRLKASSRNPKNVNNHPFMGLNCAIV